MTPTPPAAVLDDRAALERAIADDPDADTPRLALADLLQERGGTVECGACGKAESVIEYPDDRALTICPECCDKAEHPDGETGHQFDHDKWERDGVCRYCGILRRCTEHAYDD